LAGQKIKEKKPQTPFLLKRRRHVLGSGGTPARNGSDESDPLFLGFPYSRAALDFVRLRLTRISTEQLVSLKLGFYRCICCVSYRHRMDAVKFAVLIAVSLAMESMAAKIVLRAWSYAVFDFSQCLAARDFNLPNF
jgi:hypothetical protein